METPPDKRRLRVAHTQVTLELRIAHPTLFSLDAASDETLVGRRLLAAERSLGMEWNPIVFPRVWQRVNPERR